MRKNAICIKICDNCGANVEIYHKERLDRENIFCSKKCEGEYRIKHKGYNTECAVCGKPMYIKPSRLLKSKTGKLCCSKECSNKLKKEIYLGENNPNYGNTGDNNPLYIGKLERISTHGYKLIRLSEEENHPFSIDGNWIREHRYVAEKHIMVDQQSIEIDGNKYLNPELHVHHIDNDKLNNDPNNLIILSPSEHMKVHKGFKVMATYAKK